MVELKMQAAYIRFYQTLLCRHTNEKEYVVRLAECSLYLCTHTCMYRFTVGFAFFSCSYLDACNVFFIHDLQALR